MCGIFGLVSTSDTSYRADAARAVSLLAHRGPDGQGLWHRAHGVPAVTFGHRRLPILDLSNAGAQPMTRGGCCLTFNGEIYNYVELREELTAKGPAFGSGTDTEVILAAYREWGHACVERLNGMFAFAIWDDSRGELFAARDRFGEKPFLYAFDRARGIFAFASEAKALLALPFVDHTLDERALFRFVRFAELAAAEQTLWKGIKRLPHAHTLRLRTGDALTLEMRRYWDLDLQQSNDVSVDGAAARFRELFRDSVRIRLRADVPAGTSLSGGLDSSSIVCQIHELGSAAGQMTFSARMSDTAMDEGQHIEAVLQQTGIPNRQVWPAAEDFAASFSRLCYHQEEPFPATSQFAQFLVMRLAAEAGVTVLLDGQGADELLAGYTPYFSARYTDLARTGSLAALHRERQAFAATNRTFPMSPRAIASRMFPRAYRVLRPAASRAVTPHDSAAADGWWNEEWLRSFADEHPIPQREAKDLLTSRLYADTMQGELQELLRYADRNSMAWSREVRQPFLDHRLAEFAFALPSAQKIHKGLTKVVLRRAMRGLVPSSILDRTDKLGYQAPLAGWLRGPLASWTEARIESVRGSLAPFVRADLSDLFRSRRDHLGEREAWPVVSLLTLDESRRQLASVRTTTADAAVNA